MKSLMLGLLFLPLILSTVASAASVKEGDIDGIKLGMACKEALEMIKAGGYTVNEKTTDCVGSVKDDSTSKSKLKMGTTIKFRERGLPDLMLRHIDGTIYQIQKQSTYIPSRLPKGVTAEKLKKESLEKYTKMFGSVREKNNVSRNLVLHFDDEAAPPYSDKITSPHATINVREGRGTLVITVDMHWKKLVGANW